LLERMLRSQWFRQYVIPILSVVIATGLRYISNPLLGSRSPLLFHMLGVAVVAQLSGMVPALIATGLSAGLIDYYFMAPFNSLALPNRADIMALILFSGAGIILSIFGGWQKRAKDEVVEVRCIWGFR
jgi:K+-sensing histidine kinase KdpD